MLFENCKTWTDQGNVGEARAIFELANLGYTIYKPLFQNTKSDLIVEKEGKLFKVQVKTSRVDRRTHGGGFRVQLYTSGGNTKTNTIRNRQEGDYDMLFIVHITGRCWLIPVESLRDANADITVGGIKYSEFEITGTLGTFKEENRPSDTNERMPYISRIPKETIRELYVKNEGDIGKTIRALGYRHISQRQRETVRNIVNDITVPESPECKHFTKEELERLVFEKPVYKIGEQYGLSDNAVHRWIKKWKIETPPKGYFLKK